MVALRVRRCRLSLPQPFRSMCSRSSSRTRLVWAPAHRNKQHKGAPPPTSVTPSLSPKSRAPKPRCLPESLPTSSLNQSSLMRQVGMRNRRHQWYGHLDRATEKRAFSKVPPFAPLPGRPITRQWRPSVCGQADSSKIGFDVGVVPQRKVPRRRGWACRFQNRGGSGSRMGGNLQGNEGNPPRRAGVSRFASSQPGAVEASPPTVCGDSTDQRNNTAREFGGGPSDGFDLGVVLAPVRSLAFVSRYQVVHPVRVAGHFRVWSIRLHSQAEHAK